MKGSPLKTFKFLREHENTCLITDETFLEKTVPSAGSIIEHDRVYAFITKYSLTEHYTPDQYNILFEEQEQQLKHFLNANKSKIIYLFTLGNNSNKFGIQEKYLIPLMRRIRKSYPNVVEVPE